MPQNVRLTGMDKSGISRDTPSIILPHNQLSDALNVRFRNNTINKMRGEENVLGGAFTVNTITSNNEVAAQENISLSNLHYWPNPRLVGDSSGFYIVGTAERQYLIRPEINRSGTSRIAPRLVNPRTSISNGLAQGVTFFDALGRWDTDTFTGGFALIHNNGINTPQFMLDGGNDESLVLQDLPGWNYQNSVDAGSARTGYDVSAGIVRSFGNVLIAGNLSRTVQTYDATRAYVEGETTYVGTATQGTVYEARRAVAIGNAPADNNQAGEPVANADWMPTDIQRVTNLTGTIRVSDAAAPGTVPQTWDPFRNGADFAEERELTDTSQVRNIVPLQGQAIIYTSDSIHSLSLGVNNIITAQVAQGWGTLNNTSVVEFDGKHFVVDVDDIYLFAGHPGNIQSVADARVRDYLYSNLHPVSTNNTHVVLNKSQDEIWVNFPNRQSISGFCNEALIWNYRSNTWTRRDLNDVVASTDGPVTGGGLPEQQFTFDGSTGQTRQFAGNAEVQTITIEPTAFTTPGNEPLGFDLDFDGNTGAIEYTPPPISGQADSFTRPMGTSVNLLEESSGTDTFDEDHTLFTDPSSNTVVANLLPVTTTGEGQIQTFTETDNAAVAGTINQLDDSLASVTPILTPSTTTANLMRTVQENTQEQVINFNQDGDINPQTGAGYTPVVSSGITIDHAGASLDPIRDYTEGPSGTVRRVTNSPGADQSGTYRTASTANRAVSLTLSPMNTQSGTAISQGGSYAQFLSLGNNPQATYLSDTFTSTGGSVTGINIRWPISAPFALGGGTTVYFGAWIIPGNNSLFNTSRLNSATGHLLVTGGQDFTTSQVTPPPGSTELVVRHSVRGSGASRAGLSGTTWSFSNLGGAVPSGGTFQILIHIGVHILRGGVNPAGGGTKSLSFNFNEASTAGPFSWSSQGRPGIMSTSANTGSGGTSFTFPSTATSITGTSVGPGGTVSPNQSQVSFSTVNIAGARASTGPLNGQVLSATTSGSGNDVTHIFYDSPSLNTINISGGTATGSPNVSRFNNTDLDDQNFFTITNGNQPVTLTDGTTVTGEATNVAFNPLANVMNVDASNGNFIDNLEYNVGGGAFMPYPTNNIIPSIPAGQAVVIRGDLNVRPADRNDGGSLSVGAVTAISGMRSIPSHTFTYTNTFGVSREVVIDNDDTAPRTITVPANGNLDTATLTPVYTSRFTGDNIDSVMTDLYHHRITIADNNMIPVFVSASGLNVDSRTSTANHLTLLDHTEGTVIDADGFVTSGTYTLPTNSETPNWIGFARHGRDFTDHPILEITNNGNADFTLTMLTHGQDTASISGGTVTFDPIPNNDFIVPPGETRRLFASAIVPSNTEVGNLQVGRGFNHVATGIGRYEADRTTLQIGFQSNVDRFDLLPGVMHTFTGHQTASQAAAEYIAVLNADPAFITTMDGGRGLFTANISTEDDSVIQVRVSPENRADFELPIITLQPMPVEVRRGDTPLTVTPSEVLAADAGDGLSSIIEIDISGPAVPHRNLENNRVDVHADGFAMDRRDLPAFSETIILPFGVALADGSAIAANIMGRLNSNPLFPFEVTRTANVLTLTSRATTSGGVLHPVNRPYNTVAVRVEEAGISQLAVTDFDEAETTPGLTDEIHGAPTTIELTLTTDGMENTLNTFVLENTSNTDVAQQVFTALNMNASNDYVVRLLNSNTIDIRLADLTIETNQVFDVRVIDIDNGMPATESTTVTGSVSGTTRTSNPISTDNRFTIEASGNDEIFNNERPWPTDEFNDARTFVVMARPQANTLTAADIGFTFVNDDHDPNDMDSLPTRNYQSYFERTQIDMTQVVDSMDTKHLKSFYIQSQAVTGGQDADFDVKVRATNTPADIPDLTIARDMDGNIDPVNNTQVAQAVDFNTAEDYKSDVRITGRYISYRVEETGDNGWSIPALEMEIDIAGRR